MTVSPSTLRTLRVGGQVDPAWATSAPPWTAVRAVATLAPPDGGAPAVDPTNGAHEHPLTVANQLTVTAAGGQWCTAPLKPTQATNPALALQPSGLTWTIEVSLQRGNGWQVVQTYVVALDGATDYSAHMITVAGVSAVDINALIPIPITSPPSDAFGQAVVDAIGRYPQSVAADLSVTRTNSTVTVVSSTGTDAVLPSATSSLAGQLTAADKAKLDAITGTNTGDQTATTVPVTPTGNLSSATAQAALIELQSDIDALGAGVLNILSLGGIDRTGATDMTAKLQQALNLMQGGATYSTLFLPPGTYRVDSALTLANASRFRIAGLATTFTQTILLFKGAGSGVAFNFGSATYLELNNLAITYDNASFTGTLLKLGQGAVDGSWITVSNCFIGGVGSTISATYLLDLRGCQTTTFRSCDIRGGQYLVRCNSSGSFSHLRFNDCSFTNYTTAAILNPDTCFIHHCVVEPTTDSSFGLNPSLGALLPAAVRYETGMSSNCLSVTGCWIGDNLTDAGLSEQPAWFDFRGNGFYFAGNYIGISFASVFKALGQVDGVSIIGNHVFGNYHGAIADFSTHSGTDQAELSRSVAIIGNNYVQTDGYIFRNDVVPAHSIWHGNKTEGSRLKGDHISWKASAVPTNPAVRYDRGDVIWNSSATSGGTAGWICVAAGYPGTWKAFGTIS